MARAKFQGLIQYSFDLFQLPQILRIYLYGFLVISNGTGILFCSLVYHAPIVIGFCVIWIQANSPQEFFNSPVIFF
jgi:hypothetical protein